MHRRTALVGLLAAAVTGLGAVQLLPGGAPEARADGLVGYTDCDVLLEHYQSELAAAPAFGPMLGGVLRESQSGTDTRADAAGAPTPDAGAVGSGPTGTNLQEQGVDEPDLAKLRDGRLVVVSGNRLRLLAAGAQPRELGSLRLGDEQTYGGELLLVGERALVVVPGYRQLSPVCGGAPTDSSTGVTGDAARSMMFAPGTPTTYLALVDLTGDTPRLIEDATYDAQYVSARLVEGTVRLVTTTRPQVPVVYPDDGSTLREDEITDLYQRAARTISLAEVLPQVVRRDASGATVEAGNAVTCDQTFHARTPVGASTLLVTTMRPGDGLAATDRTAVTTDGDLVYAAPDRLYVATSRWGTVGPMPALDGAARASRTTVADEVSTELHGFDTSSSTTTRYVGSGTVPGYVLGRWALSWHEGALRVATTRQPPWTSDDGQSASTGETSSMLVKLEERDGALVETGRVGGLGRTEQIKAVRYFGDVAAVVTFRQTDPLYLLDLSGTPRVLGELKIPGFSTYLHPLGDGKLLGVGQDADKDGQVTGMAVSVFDISDLTRPALLDRLTLGQGWSAALDDSRAFGYDPARRLATLPFTAWDPTGQNPEQNSALGITVGADGTLRTTGRLALDAGQWPSRVLHDDTSVYAISDTGVVAADASTFKRTGTAPFPLP